MSAQLKNPFADEFYARFYRDSPQVLLESAKYAILWKPHNFHTAPLREGESGNLLSWYLSLPETPNEAKRVTGKKPVERGLLHRLDFATAGLVLIAKTQKAFDFLERCQKAGRVLKEYYAFCDCLGKEITPYPPCAEDEAFCIKSRFRAFGPGGKEVRPIFCTPVDAKCKKRLKATKEYSTRIAVKRVSDDGKAAFLSCVIDLGFRHQIRAHLVSIGFPICADELYNPLCKGRGGEGGQGQFMQLIAVALNFPNPEGEGLVSFSLPPKDKTSL